MMLYNTKSILECKFDDEINMHYSEINNYIKQLQIQMNYNCAVIIKYFDEGHKYRDVIIKECLLHDCLETTQYADIKNGIDMACIDGYITFICYGTEYMLNNLTFFTTTGIQIRPYDNKRNFIENILK